MIIDQEPTLAAIRPECIDPDAAKVVRRLTRYGFEAYLVGGCVRDLLLGRKPKDFDVATSATPPEIKKLFRNCRIIGRRFRLAHIFFGDKIIETSTFRAQPALETPPDGATPILRQDNVFGTAREDALRRDFTVNGLFLDLAAQRVMDHVGGLADLHARQIRTIGDPRVRVQEDPVRIIRAVKFAARLGFTIDPDTLAAMIEFRQLLAQCSVARVLEELYRLLGSGHAAPTLELMHRTGALAVLLPELSGLLGPPPDPRAQTPVMPIHDRSGEPPTASEANGETVARDAAPEPALPRAAEAPSPEEQGRFQRDLDQLLTDLVGPSAEERTRAGELTLSHVAQLDQVVAASAPPPSHALLLASSLMGLAQEALRPERPMAQAMPALETLISAVAGRLRVSRRDRERLKQILVAQKRMLQRGRRSRPGALRQREYFADAWQLLQLSCTTTGENADVLARWHGILGSSGRDGRKRRRRRRRRHEP